MKILIHFYYDLGASTLLLLCSCRFCAICFILTKFSNCRRGMGVLVFIELSIRDAATLLLRSLRTGYVLYAPFKTSL